MCTESLAIVHPTINFHYPSLKKPPARALLVNLHSMKLEAVHTIIHLHSSSNVHRMKNFLLVYVGHVVHDFVKPSRQEMSNIGQSIYLNC